MGKGTSSGPFICSELFLADHTGDNVTLRSGMLILSGGTLYVGTAQGTKAMS
jgi:hypothetical protein